MLSKITIEVDFDNGNDAALQILYRPSDDVRDKLIKSFLERLGHRSSWCAIWCAGAMEESQVNYAAQKWIIKTLHPNSLNDHRLSMEEQLRVQKQPTKYDIVQPPAKDEYVCMELRDDEGKITGLNVFYNGEIVHTWTIPNNTGI